MWDTDGPVRFCRPHLCSRLQLDSLLGSFLILCTAVYKNTNPSPAVKATAAQTASHCHWNIIAFIWGKWFYFLSCNRVSLTLLKCCSYKNKDLISGDLGFLHLAPFVQNQQSIRYLDYVVSR